MSRRRSRSKSVTDGALFGAFAIAIYFAGPVVGPQLGDGFSLSMLFRPRTAAFDSRDSDWRKSRKPFNDSGIGEVGGNQYDILGLKIGMSPEEVRQAVHSCAISWKREITSSGERWKCVDATTNDQYRFKFSSKGRAYEIYLQRTLGSLTIDDFYTQVASKYPTASQTRCSTYGLVGDNCFPLPDGSVLSVGWRRGGTFWLGLRSESVLVEDEPEEAHF